MRALSFRPHLLTLTAAVARGGHQTHDDQAKAAANA